VRGVPAGESSGGVRGLAHVSRPSATAPVEMDRIPKLKNLPQGGNVQHKRRRTVESLVEEVDRHEGRE